MPAADGGVIISRSKDGDIILSKDGAEPVDDEAEVAKEEGVGAAGGAAAASGGAVAGGPVGVGGGGAAAEAAAAEAVAFRAAAAAEDAVAEARRCTQFTCFTSQHTSAYVSIRHTSAAAEDALRRRGGALSLLALLVQKCSGYVL
jgi:hypothetical protein